ncbi:lipopolysaccharide biosynthesis protein [bacterium]
MLTKIKNTAKHTLIYALGNMSAKLVGFVLLPLYTKQIPLAAYGMLGLVEMIDMLATHLFSVGLHQALLRWHGLADEETRKKRYTFSIFIFLFLFCLLGFITVLLIRNPLSEVLFNDDQYGYYFVILFVGVTFNILNKIPLTLLRIEEKSIRYAISVGIQFGIALILNIVFIAFLKLGVAGILTAQMIAPGVLMFILLPYLIKRMTLQLDIPELKKMIVFSYPFIFAAVGATALNLGNRYVLKLLGTLEDVGVYTLAFKFSNFLKIFFVDALSLGLPVVGWQVVKNNDNPQRFLSKVLTYFIFILCWSSLALSSISHEIVRLFALNQDYWFASEIIPLLALSVILMGFYRVFYFALQIPQKTHLIPLLMILAAGVNIILNLVLVPHWGVWGSAIAIVMASLFLIVITYWNVQRVYPVSYELKRLMMLLVIATGLFIITKTMDSWSVVLKLFGKGLLVLVYPILLYLLKFFEPVELNRIKGSIIKWRGKILKVN